MGIGGDDRYWTESQRQWARWAANGYAKWCQPTSMLWVGGAVSLAPIAGFLAILYLAAHGKL
jgi:hypothetical protein